MAQLETKVRATASGLRARLQQLRRHAMFTPCFHRMGWSSLWMSAASLTRFTFAYLVMQRVDEGVACAERSCREQAALAPPRRK